MLIILKLKFIIVMSSLLIVSTVLITLALVFYSIGIWSERFSRYLKPWHTAMFWLGFLFDLSGTYSMHLMAKTSMNLTEHHTITGQIAIWVMLAHAIWATVVILKGSEKSKIKFHRYSIVVWCIWLIPYFGGVYMGMNR